MSEERKQQQRDRYLRQQKHWRSREEEQQLDEVRKARRAERRRGGGAARGGDDETFAPIRRQHAQLPPQQKQAVVPNTAEARGVVVWLGRGRARVATADGEVAAQLAPELAREQQAAIAVGDDVALHLRGAADAVVVAVGERRSELARTDPHDAARRRVLAANVDVVVLVLTAGRLRTGLIDRLRMALAEVDAELVVFVNKADLEHDAAALDAALQPYRAQGLAVFVGAALTGAGVEAFAERLRGRAVAVVGHSGVGKSTLLNRLDPELQRPTAEVREKDQRGRHTTTATSLRMLADGTRLIDTPGVRAFGLEESDALAAFPDIAELGRGCRFRDCAHDREPGCAVRAAVTDGGLAAERHVAYLRLRDAGG
ncbi:MAG: ribosome small subunit-dependent GTPase A [Planctomycetota bacterium]